MTALFNRNKKVYVVVAVATIFNYIKECCVTEMYVCGVFTSRKKAEDVARRLGKDYTAVKVLEFEVNTLDIQDVFRVF